MMHINKDELFTENVGDRIIHRLDGQHDIRPVGLGVLDPAVHRPHLAGVLRLREGRQGPVVVGGEVLYQDKTGDARGVLGGRGFGQLLLVAHDRNFQRPVGELDNHGGRQLVGGGRVGTEAAVDDGVHGRNLRDLTFGFRSNQQRGEKTGVDILPQFGEIVDSFPKEAGDVEQANGEGSQLLLLAVGELLLQFHILLEGRQAVLVYVDGEGEGTQLLLDATQGGVELVNLDSHG